MRTIKLSATMFMVIFLISAVVAPAAHAGRFTSNTYPMGGSGSNTGPVKYKFQGQEVTCNSLSVTGGLAAASEEIELTPEHKECTAFGFINAEVKMNGCKIAYTAAGTRSIFNNHQWEGSTHIKCSAGASITVVASNCTVHIPAQTPTVNKVDYENETGTPKSILYNLTVEGIHSNITSGFLCPLTANATDTTGTAIYPFTLSGGGGSDLDIGH